MDAEKFETDEATIEFVKSTQLYEFVKSTQFYRDLDGKVGPEQADRIIQGHNRDRVTEATAATEEESAHLVT
jgi:hypothetical protein